MNHMEEKSKFVVSCSEDWDNWAHLLCKWANAPPEAEIQSRTPEADDEPDTDVEHVTSLDSSSEDNGEEDSSRQTLVSMICSKFEPEEQLQPKHVEV
jgi:hypothetical protein